jgi:hypothetical protein
LLLAVSTATALAGCATVPECEAFDVGILDTQAGRFYLLDQENLEKLFVRQLHLQEGKCRLPLPPVEGAEI